MRPSIHLLICVPHVQSKRTSERNEDEASIYTTPCVDTNRIAGSLCRLKGIIWQCSSLDENPISHNKSKSRCRLQDRSLSAETANISRSQTVQLRRRLAYFSKSGAEQCHAGARTIIASDVIACQVRRNARGPSTLRFVERKNAHEDTIQQDCYNDCLATAAGRFKAIASCMFCILQRRPDHMQCLLRGRD